MLTELKIPSKAMLFGEYAVLSGGPCVMVPLPLYFKIYECDKAGAVAYTPVIDLAMAYPIPEVADYEAINGAPYVYYDNSSFYISNGNNTEQKLGIGLSAAEAVGAIKLRFARAGLNVDENLRKIAEYAWLIHRTAQEGLGSGADVFCCAYEAPIKFRLESQIVRCEKIEYTDDVGRLPMYLVYSGHGFNTREAIKRYLHWDSEPSNGDAELVHRLIESSQYVAEDWCRNQSFDTFNALDNFLSIMKEASARAGINYWTERHSELDRWARKYGGRAKPVGAGGGDMILIIGDVPIDEIVPDSYRYCIKIPSEYVTNTDPEIIKTR